MHNHFYPLFITIFLYLIIYITKAADASISVSPTDKKINQITTYQFSIVDQKFLIITNTTAVIQITFPSGFFSLNLSQTYTCSNKDSPSNIYPCRAISSNVFQINNPMVSSAILRVVVSSFKNPSSADYVTFGYNFKYANTTLISQATSLSASIYSPGSFNNCSASFSPSLVHQVGEITININLGNTVPANGKIVVQFPSTWLNSVNSSFPPIVNGTTQSCRRISTTNFLMSNLTCDLFQRQIIFTSSFNNTAPSGTSLSFAISNILSPPTINSGNVITVQTFTSTDGQIDKTTACSIDLVSAKSISSVTSSSQLMVGSNSTYVLEFISPTPIMAGDRISIISQSPNTDYFSLYAGSTGFISPNFAIVSGQNSNSSSISVVLSSSMTVISSLTTIRVQGIIYIKPLISSGIRSLTLILRRDTLGYIYASQSFSLTISSNYLQNVTITLNTYSVSTVAVYTFSFNLFNQLAPKSRIIITLPNQLSISNGNCISTITSNTSNSLINSSYTCTVTSNKIITLSNINSMTLPANDRLTIAINSILNSQTTQDTGQFSIMTYYGDTLTTPTDISTDKTVKMTTATIGFASVTSLSKTVAQQTVYTIVYTVRTKFLSNSKIKIALPSDITIGSSLSATFMLSYTDSTNSTQQSCSIANSSVSSVQYLQISGISSIELPASTNITIKISLLKNPTSLKPSSSFGLYQIDTNGFQIQKIQAGLTITNTITNSFIDLFAAQSTNRINGQNAIYSINFKSSVDLFVNDYFLLQFQATNNSDAQISYVNPITSCDILYTQNGTTVTTSTTVQRQSSTLLKATINQNLPNTRSYQIAIDSIKRSRTAQNPPSKLFIKTFKYVTGTSAFGISSGTIQPKQNNKQNVLQSISLNIMTSPSQLFSYQSFSITIVPKNNLILGDYLILTVPTLYKFNGTIFSVNSTTNLSSVSSQSFCVQTQFFCSNFNSDPTRIKIQQFGSNFSSTSSLTFTIKNNLYLSPQTFSFTGYYFQASSYSKNSLIIDSTITSGSTTTNVANAQFYLTCRTNLSSYHCKTCSLNGSCTACYLPLTINAIQYDFDGYKYMTSDAKCVSQCGLGYFVNNATGICTKCDSPCLACINTSLTCLSCLSNVTNNFYYSNNYSCLYACPNGFYSDTQKICQQCSSSCLTCQTTSISCTSCNSSTFLNSNTNTCVTSTNCPSSTFADTSTNKCTACDVSCLTCFGLKNNCTQCAVGYIDDFLNSTFRNCTNNCPAGLVNDTVNNRGCRCQTQCKTCEGTVSTCKSCDTTSVYKYYYSSSCVSTCPQGTYLGKINGTIDGCIDCTQSNCKVCSSTACLQCSGTYSVYEGACLLSCPVSSVLQIISSVRTCVRCYVGCINCQKGVGQCTTCDNGYLKQGNSTNTYCTTSCSAGKVNFNNSICYSSCPSGYEDVGGVCKSNGTNSNTQTDQSLSVAKTVPFPFIIAAVILITIILLIRIVIDYLLVSTMITCVMGILQVLSWLTAIIVTSLQVKSGQHLKNCSTGMILFIIALILGVGLNILAVLFFNKYIAKDIKFNQMFLYNEKKTFLKKCPTLTTVVVSLIFSHKALQLLFSNFLSSRHFSYKVSTISKFLPINYILFSSILPSILAIVGGSIISYQLQAYGTKSASFIASIDSIIITVLGIIFSIWVANRKPQDYQQDIHKNVGNGKHYETQQQFADTHPVQDFSQNINDVFLQQSGVRRVNDKFDKGKNYYYKSARYSQKSEHHDNDPLAKRKNTTNPIKQVDPKKLKVGSNITEDSSQALIIIQNQKRRNLKQQFEESSQNVDQQNKKKSLIESELLRNSSNSMPSNKDLGMITKIHYGKKLSKQKPQQLRKMSIQQKKLFKEKIQNQIDPQQKQKLNILKKEKDINDIVLKNKKEKILKLAKLAEQKDQKINQLQKEDQKKIQNIKQAVDLLKRKQIKIQEYLLYTEIIKEEEGQYDEDDQENRQISEINQLTNNIFKGPEDQDRDLEEVINLSPKKVLLSGTVDVNSPNRKNNLLQGNSHTAENKNSLKKSASKDHKSSASKDKKSVSTKKIAKRNLNKSKQKKHKKNQPSDLMVNYKYDQSNGKNQNQVDKSFDSQQQPQIPKVRSNIVAQQGKLKSRNRSQQNFNQKKKNKQDLLMINVGHRNNRSQNQLEHFGGQLQEQHGDQAPPKYIHSTQKVTDYKNKNSNEYPDKNIYDFQNQIETLKSFQHLDHDFYDQISPTRFDQQNIQRFNQGNEQSDIPQKPKIISQEQNQHNVTIDKKQNNIRNKNDGFNIYQNEYEQDMPQRRGQSRINSSMNRYASTSQIDYGAMLRKNNQHQKLKQLEQIYLPRLQNKNTKRSRSKRDLNISKLSKSKQKL